MKQTLCLAAIAGLAFAASASAATSSVGWTTQDMKTAVRGLGYPKPHPKKLACKTLGIDAFRCVATYRHHRHTRFTVTGKGAWLCATKTAASCGWLRRGFVTTRQIDQRYGGTLAGAAQFAAKAYMSIKYGINYLTTAPGGGQTGPTTWTFSYYTSNTSTVLVTIAAKQAKGGYVITGSAS